MEVVADKSPRNVYGRTPLHFAAKHGYLEAFKFLIENVDLRNSIDNLSKTPLGIAPRKRHFKICALLLKSRIPLSNPLDSQKTKTVDFSIQFSTRAGEHRGYVNRSETNQPTGEHFTHPGH